MSTTINAARMRAHLSRHERQRLARAEAFSRRTTASPPATPAIQLQQGELELIEGLVRHNRTAVSSSVLAISRSDQPRIPRPAPGPARRTRTLPS